MLSQQNVNHDQFCDVSTQFENQFFYHISQQIKSLIQKCTLNYGFNITTKLDANFSNTRAKFQLDKHNKSFI